MSETGHSLQALVQEFFTLQAHRLDTYKRLEESHDAYLGSAPDYDFPHYRQAVHDATQAFAESSRRALVVQEELRAAPGVGSPERAELVAHISRVQDAEKEKLQLVGRLTAQLQLAKQSALEHLGEEAYEDQVHLYRQRLMKVMEKIGEILEDFKYDSEDVE
ncbi:required for excision 1-B domain-containing protein [Lethenteron reissneri]|uniref:required for excision 1-B domain-containing protein n=1 Tax=Lethenteron reissneri TaxID=7753 RepID=UPI002AB6629A|nr:required for excision 1-B domain-containing protein [Lethenteron reissneri]